MIIIGLGNKGLSYKNTYHNMGFDVVNKLAKELGVRFSHAECKAKTAVTNVSGTRIVLAKPETYMNLSGESVRELMGKYKESADGILVIYDDVDIAIGTIRARNGGSAGTHNGMRNIVECLNGNTSFKRIRIGTGFEHGDVPLYNVVLSKVKGENKTLVDASTDFVTKELLAYLSDRDFDKLMRNVNGFKPE